MNLVQQVETLAQKSTVSNKPHEALELAQAALALAQAQSLITANPPREEVEIKAKSKTKPKKPITGPE